MDTHTLDRGCPPEKELAVEPEAPVPSEDLGTRPIVLDALDIGFLLAIAALFLLIVAGHVVDRRTESGPDISVVSLSDIASEAKARFRSDGVPEHEARLMALYTVSAAEARLAEAQASGALGSVFDRDALHVSSGLPDLTADLLEICLDDVRHMLPSAAAAAERERNLEARRMGRPALPEASP